MGKASSQKRERLDAQEIHARIAAEAKAANERPQGVRPASDVPETQKLLMAARKELASRMPSFVMYEGRKYWLRAQLHAVQLEVFDSPATGDPLIVTLFGSSDDTGHMPAH